MDKNTLNMTLPKVSLDQWIIFQTIVQTGSYINAAKMLNKSQSSIGYNITKMQELIDIKLFDIKGSKAVLTEMGELILKRSQIIVNQLSQLESSIAHYKKSSAYKFKLLVDELFPVDLLAIILERFEKYHPATHVMLVNHRTSLSKRAFMESQADCAITQNKIHAESVKILTLKYYLYAHPDYCTFNDNQDEKSKTHLRKIVHKQGLAMQKDDSSQQCCQWEVDSINMMIELIGSKQGYGYLPSLHVNKSALPLKRLEIDNETAIESPLYLNVLDPLLMTQTQKTFLAIITELAIVQ